MHEGVVNGRRPPVSQEGARETFLCFSRTRRSSVVTTNRVTAVHAFFADATVQYTIKVDIYSSKIPSIARGLFRLVNEIEDGYLFLKPNSDATLSFDTIALSGTTDRGGAEKLFGTLFQNYKRGESIWRGARGREFLSNLISLKINGGAENPSCLSVPDTAQTILMPAVQLWPSF